jgi:hypothetical protein
MTMLSLTENECSWIEFLRLIADGTDPAPDLRSVQALRHALDIGQSDGARHAALDPNFGNQGAPFPSPASAGPASKPRKVTVFRSAAQNRHRQPCLGQVGGEGASRD